MSLKIKVGLLLTGAIALFSAAEFGIQRFIIYPSFIQMEDEDAVKDAHRVIQAIGREIHHLDLLTRDWASWDDTYHFMRSRSPEYIESNLMLETFQLNRTHLLYFVDSAGRVLWGEIRNLETGERLQSEAFPSDVLPEDHPALIPHEGEIHDGHGERRGILLTERGPVLISARPVLKSDDSGPSRGTLIMGRFLDASAVKSLKQQTEVAFHLTSVTDLPPGGKNRKRLARIGEETPFVIERESASALNIYGTVADIRKQPALLMAARIPRRISTVGKSAMNFALLSILLTGAGTLALMLTVVQFTVLNPIIGLTDYVLKAGKTDEEQPGREPQEQPSGNEVKTLAREFDRMLRQTRRKKTELESLNRELEADITARETAERALREGRNRLRRQNEILVELMNKRVMYGENLEQTLMEISAASARNLGVERVTVWLLTEDRKRIFCKYRYQVSDDSFLIGNASEAADCPSYFKMLETERFISSSNAFDGQHEPGIDEFRKDYLEPGGIGAVLVTPVWITGRQAGVIIYEHQGQPRTWEADEESFAGSIADFISLAMETDEHRQAEKIREELEARLLRAEKMEAIGTLAGGVAHDLNNILSGLVSYPELILLQLSEDSPLVKPLTTVKRSGEKAVAMVQDLLTLARRGVPADEIVQINDIVADYLKSPQFERLISHHPGIEVETHLEGELLQIIGSPVHLFKTVMNLFSNAVEALTGKGRVVLTTANRYVDRPIRGYDRVEEGDYAVLTVSDTGVGISPEARSRIFEPFFTKKKMGRSGTGLGMTVVWGTVKDHRGYIDVESREGRGTVFTLYFPVTRRERPGMRSPSRITEYAGNGASVLVIDDVPEQREIAASMLEKLGYDVKTVPGGEAAVAHLHEHHADLLILDMIMEPGIDGLETYRRIIRFRPGQRAVIVSGFAETENVRALQRLGAGPYIKKPYSLEKIGAAAANELKRGPDSPPASPPSDFGI